VQINQAIAGADPPVAIGRAERIGKEGADIYCLFVRLAAVDGGGQHERQEQAHPLNRVKPALQIANTITLPLPNFLSQEAGQRKYELSVKHPSRSEDRSNYRRLESMTKSIH
jgi:hypothetical protein